MRTYACVNDNIVVQIIEIDPSDYIHYGSIYQLVIDIDEMVVKPEIGWIMGGGGALVPPAEIDPSNLPEYRLECICRSARKFGQGLSMIAADKIGGRNLMLGKTEQQIQTFAGQLMQLKLILDGGALVTSRMVMVAMKAAYPEYSDLFQWSIDEIDHYRGLI